MMGRDGEIYAAAGLALRWAQLFEAEVVTVALLHGVARRKFRTRAQAEDFVASSERKPLSQLLRKVLARVKFQPDVSGTFDEAIEVRNAFVHRFFWDHAEAFADDNRIDELIAQLKDNQRLFFSAHKFASMLSEMYRDQLPAQPQH